MARSSLLRKSRRVYAACRGRVQASPNLDVAATDGQLGCRLVSRSPLTRKGLPPILARPNRRGDGGVDDDHPRDDEVPRSRWSNRVPAVAGEWAGSPVPPVVSYPDSRHTLPPRLPSAEAHTMSHWRIAIVLLFIV